MSDLKRNYLGAALLALSVAAGAQAAALKGVGWEVSTAAEIGGLPGAYQRKTGNRIHLNPTDTTKGIREVQDGSADLGSSTQYLLPDEPHEAGLELVPVAWDALTIIVHKDNPVPDISLEQLRSVYSGKIRNWSELGGNDQKIDVLVHHYGNTPAASNLREMIFSDSRKLFRVGRLMKPTDSVGELLSTSPGGIAITGVSNARALDVKIVSLDGITPTIDTIKRGQYSLYRPLYLTYNPNSEKLDSIKDFISYMNSKDARELMRANGVVPYTDAMRLVMKKVRANEASYPQAVDKIELSSSTE